MNVSAVTVGNKIYFAGGATLPLNYKGIDIYDDVTKSWTTSSLQELEGYVSGAAIGNTIYWAGRYWLGGNIYSTKVEIWNTANASITNSCLSFVRNPKAVAKNNEVAFFGWDNNYAVTNRFDIFNAQTNLWSIGLINTQLAGPEIIKVNNTVYMAGGILNGNQSNKVYTLNW